MWLAAEQTLESKRSKKSGPSDAKLDASAPTLKLKMAPAVIPPPAQPKGSQRRTSTVIALDAESTVVTKQQPTKAAVSKSSKKKRQSDTVDDELLDLMEIEPPKQAVPVDGPPKVKKVKLALTAPNSTPKPAEIPPNGKTNGNRPLHGLPPKPMSNIPSAAPNARSTPVPQQSSERKIKLSGISRASSVTATPPAPAPQLSPSDKGTTPLISDSEGGMVSSQWRELPGRHLPIRKLRVQKYLQDLIKEPAFAPVCWLILALVLLFLTDTSVPSSCNRGYRAWVGRLIHSFRCIS